MLIVDSQIHLWKEGGAPPHHWRAPFKIDDALREMDVAGVDRAVNCPPGWEAESNAYAVEAARAHPDRFATLGWFDLSRPLDEAAIRRFVSQPGMLGLRFVMVTSDLQQQIANGDLDWLWSSANKLGLPVGLMVRPDMYGAIAEIAGRNPHARFLLDHLGIGPFSKLPEAASFLEEFLALARLPNVAAKATGTPSMALDDYPFASARPVVERAYQVFGPKRLFWGTDVTRLHCSWRQCVTQFTEEMDFLKGEDLEWVMGRGVCEWIGWSR